LSKPILYHDIDGVLFGNYGGEFQLRPALKTWLKWVHEHFDVVFLTMWRHEEIDTLLSVLTVEKFMKSLQAPGSDRRIGRTTTTKNYGLLMRWQKQESVNGSG
jgi:hypothetical protein